MVLHQCTNQPTSEPQHREQDTAKTIFSFKAIDNIVFDAGSILSVLSVSNTDQTDKTLLASKTKMLVREERNGENMKLWDQESMKVNESMQE